MQLRYVILLCVAAVCHCARFGTPCAVCPALTYYDGLGCVACGAGTYWTSPTTCAPCPAGTFSNDGVSCTPCTK